MLQVRKADVAAKIPPQVFFFVSAIFHYLGPAFAVLLFSHGMRNEMKTRKHEGG
jgi:threonine/homoserine efflux transporter RhtA